jgi:cell division protein ZapA
VAVVPVSVNGRVYEIGCDDSQVARIQKLGQAVDEKAQALLQQVGTVPDARLLVMVGLMLTDELNDVRSQLQATGSDLSAAAEGDARMAAGIDALAGRIESIADRLERS